MLDTSQKKYLPFLIGTFFFAALGTAHSRVADAPKPAAGDQHQFRVIEPFELPRSTLEPNVQNAPQNELIRLAVADAATAKITKPLEIASSDCRAAGDEYLASCLASAFRAAAKAVKSSAPDYKDARKILTDTAKKLESLQKANEDKAVKKKRGKNGQYRAVKKETVVGVKKAALKIVQEAETMLIRSSGSGDRKLHYVRIAEVVGSTKVLFRS